MENLKDMNVVGVEDRGEVAVFLVADPAGDVYELPCDPQVAHSILQRQSDSSGMTTFPFSLYLIADYLDNGAFDLSFGRGFFEDEDADDLDIDFDDSLDFDF